MATPPKSRLFLLACSLSATCAIAWLFMHGDRSTLPATIPQQPSTPLETAAPPHSARAGAIAVPRINRTDAAAPAPRRDPVAIEGRLVDAATHRSIEVVVWNPADAESATRPKPVPLNENANGFLYIEDRADSLVFEAWTTAQDGQRHRAGRATWHDPAPHVVIHCEDHGVDAKAWRTVRLLFSQERLQQWIRVSPAERTSSAFPGNDASPVGRLEVARRNDGPSTRRRFILIPIAAGAMCEAALSAGRYDFHWRLGGTTLYRWLDVAVPPGGQQGIDLVVDAPAVVHVTFHGLPLERRRDRSWSLSARFYDTDGDQVGSIDAEPGHLRGRSGRLSRGARWLIGSGETVTVDGRRRRWLSRPIRVDVVAGAERHFDLHLEPAATLRVQSDALIDRIAVIDGSGCIVARPNLLGADPGLAYVPPGPYLIHYGMHGLHHESRIEVAAGRTTRLRLGD